MLIQGEHVDVFERIQVRLFPLPRRVPAAFGQDPGAVDQFTALTDPVNAAALPPFTS